MDFDLTAIIINMIKYFLEGVAVAIAMLLLQSKTPKIEELLGVSAVAAIMFAVLDVFAPAIGLTARQGAGFGLGAKLVGFPAPAIARAQPSAEQVQVHTALCPLTVVSRAELQAMPTKSTREAFQVAANGMAEAAVHHVICLAKQGKTVAEFPLTHSAAGFVSTRPNVMSLNVAALAHAHAVWRGAQTSGVVDPTAPTLTKDVAAAVTMLTAALKARLPDVTVEVRENAHEAAAWSFMMPDETVTVNWS